jgi:hypothetical protein
MTKLQIGLKGMSTTARCVYIIEKLEKTESGKEKNL